MPDWSELYVKIKRECSPQDKIRRNLIKNLSNLTKRNVILYYSGWLQKPQLTKTIDFGISDADKTGFMTVIHKMDRSKGVDLILHTPGGDMAATESIIEYLRSMFGKNIRAIVPQMAMSGGAMIACACNQIVMGNQSSIGPFDPQINGIPCQAILKDLQKAVAEITANNMNAYKWQPIIQKYPLGFFSHCEQSIAMAEEVVRKNLRECMFNDLDADAAQNLIDGIFEKLGSNSETKMHARHISKQYAIDCGLNVFDLEKDQKLQEAVLSLHHACILTFEQSPATKIIENQNGKSYISMCPPSLLHSNPLVQFPPFP